MEKPILYIMCGLPFSGKTKLAQEILKLVDLEFISIDEIKFSRGFAWTEDEQLTAEEWQSIFDESYEKSASALKSGRSVLYDSANQSRVSRDRLRELAAIQGAAAKVIFLDTPIEIVEERWKRNTETHERFHLPERFFRAAFLNYEPPISNENVVVFKQADNPVEWIKENLL